MADFRVPFYGDNEESVEDALYRDYLRKAEEGVYGPPKPPPTVLPSPNIGRVQGGFLDDVSRGVLQSLQNSPRARSMGGGIAQGALGAFASARQAGVEGRGQQLSAAQKAFEEDQKGRLAERSAAARSLAQHRWQMQRDAAKPQAAAKRMIRLTPEIRKEMEKEGIFVSSAVTELPEDNQAFVRDRRQSDPLLDERRRQIIEQGRAMNLSPKALKFYTERALAMGGDLSGIPGLSRNPRMAAAMIENAAAEADKIGMTGYDAADAKARYRAEAAALTDVTRTAERARPFANLLHKNIGVLRGTMNGIKDTGTMFGNRPVRAVVQQMGDAEQAKFNVAIVPVQKEISRLLESTNLTGTLSVQAQEELRAVLSRDFTLPQLEGALEILEAETNNRIEAYDEAMQSGGFNVGTNRPGTPGATVPLKGNEGGASLLKSIMSGVKKGAQSVVTK